MTLIIITGILIQLIIPVFVIESLSCFMNTKKIKYLYWKIMYSFIMLEMIILSIYAMGLVYNEFTELVWKTKN